MSGSSSSPGGISVIVPTIGRRTLARTLGSFAGELTQDDSVVVISDGPVQGVEEVAEEFAASSPATWVYAEHHQARDWGHSLRNYALDNYVEDGYVWTIDDDDVAAPGALDALRSRMNETWTVFRMHFGPGHYARGITCWREPVLRLGDVGTPMIFAPKCLARFGTRYEGDWDYVDALRAELGNPEWDDRVIAIIRPEEEDAQDIAPRVQAC